MYHHGGGSFGAGRQAGLARGSALLHGRYGFFRSTNRRERVEDPLAVPFAALELALDERDPSRPHVLHVLHSSPGAIGGTEKHLRTLIEAVGDEFDASILFPVESGFVLRSIWFRGGVALAEHEVLLPGAPGRVSKLVDEVAREALAAALAMDRFDAVHIHNLIGHSLAPLAALEDFDGLGGVLGAGPLPRLPPPLAALQEPPVRHARRPLGLRRVPARDQRHDRRPARGVPGDGRRSTSTWSTTGCSRARARPTTCSASTTSNRSASSSSRTVRSSTSTGRARRSTPTSCSTSPCGSASSASGWPKKGLDVVNWLAERLAGTGIEIHHFGKLRADASELHAHGPYDNEVLPELLDRAGIQVVLLPAPYAETFGHVMTEAFVAGLPVIGTSYGALAERIRAGGLGWTVDPEDRPSIEALVRALDRHRPEILRAAGAVQDLVLRPVAATADRYANIYRRPGSSGRSAEEGT